MDNFLLNLMLAFVVPFLVFLVFVIFGDNSKISGLRELIRLIKAEYFVYVFLFVDVFVYFIVIYAVDYYFFS